MGFFNTPSIPGPTPEQTAIQQQLANIQGLAVEGNLELAGELLELGKYELALREANNRTSFDILSATLQDQARLMSVNLMQLGGSLAQQQLATQIGMEGFLSAEGRTQTAFEWEMMLQEYNQGLREAFLPLLAGNLGEIMDLSIDGYMEKFNVNRFEDWMNVVSTKAFEYMNGGAPVNPALEENLKSQRALALEELARQGLKPGDSGYDARIEGLMTQQNIARESDRLQRELAFGQLATQGEQALAGLSVETGRLASSMKIGASEAMLNLIYPNRGGPLSYNAAGVQPLSIQQLAGSGPTQYNFAYGNPAAYGNAAVGAYGNIGQIGGQLTSQYNALTNLQAIAMQPQLNDFGFLTAVAGNAAGAYLPSAAKYGTFPFG